MTLSDWADETRERYRTHTPARATKLSLGELALGVGRRAVDVAAPGRAVWDREDWDIVVVMDACRVDVMREVAPEYDWIGNVGEQWSVGSASPEWMDQTFKPEYREEMARTAYITANPFSAKPADRAAAAETDALPLSDNDFAHFDEVWKTDWQDEPVSTVAPRALTDRVIDTWRRREDLGVERIVVHYMQPHIPFRSRPEWFGRRESLDNFGEPDKEGGKDPWHKVRDGEIPRAEFWAAYQDNLRWVLDDVALLRENADATFALTSDHGNGFGEWGCYSHPPKTPVPTVRKVPWTLVEARDEQTHMPTVSATEEHEIDSDIDQRLEALGYK